MTGTQMKRLRKRFGLSQAELAKKLLLVQCTISAYELGRRAISPALVRYICLVLQIPEADYMPKVFKDETPPLF